MQCKGKNQCEFMSSSIDSSRAFDYAHTVQLRHSEEPRKDTHMRRIYVSALALAFVFLFHPSSLHAQVTGTISGYVQDQGAGTIGQR